MTRRSGRTGGPRDYGALQKELRGGKPTQKPQPKNERTLKQNVHAHAKKAIRDIHKKNRKTTWDPPKLRYALGYLEWLMEGGRGRPDQQGAGQVDQTVQRCFAAACLAHNAPDDTFPGQKLSWYKERKAEAIAFAKRR